MPREVSKGKATTRRYSPDERAQAVRLVRVMPLTEIPRGCSSKLPTW